MIIKRIATIGSGRYIYGTSFLTERTKPLLQMTSICCS